MGGVILKNIYLVIGKTGEYEDKDVWIVKAYLNELSAKAHAENANKEAADYRERHFNGNPPPKNWNPWDSNMQMDYCGTTYYVEMVPFEDSL